MALFGLQLLQRKAGGFDVISSEERVQELGYACAIGFSSTLATILVLVFVDSIGTRRLDEGSNAKQFHDVLGKTLPLFIARDRLEEMKPVRYDAKPEIRSFDWLDSSTPSLGDSGDVYVIAFLDPNCGYCLPVYSSFKKLATQFRGTARFYVLPRVLWEISVLQAQALEIAATNGRYFDMWQLQLERRRQGGLGFKDIQNIFLELGLDATGLAEQLASVRPKVIKQRQKAKAAGINGTPMVFVNGRSVARPNRNERDISKLILQITQPNDAGHR